MDDSVLSEGLFGEEGWETMHEPSFYVHLRDDRWSRACTLNGSLDECSMVCGEKNNFATHAYNNEVRSTQMQMRYFQAECT